MLTFIIGLLWGLTRQGLEWDAHGKQCVCAQLLSCIQLFATPWTVACQYPLSMGFLRQEFCNELPFPIQDEYWSNPLNHFILKDIFNEKGVNMLHNFLEWPTIQVYPRLRFFKDMGLLKLSGGKSLANRDGCPHSCHKQLLSHQFSSASQSCSTLCNPKDCGTTGLPVITNSQSLLKLMPIEWWCHPTISSSVVPFSSCLQFFPASGSFQMSQCFESGDQSTGVSASASVLPMNIQDWFL